MKIRAARMPEPSASVSWTSEEYEQMLPTRLENKQQIEKLRVGHMMNVSTTKAKGFCNSRNNNNTRSNICHENRISRKNK
jgi:hypothetical protein